MSILENFKPTMPTGNTNNFGNFVSAFYNYLNLQFVKNSEKDLKITKMNQNLNAIFYKLLESKNGYITVLDLAIKSGLDSMIVTDFLNQKVQHFGGKSMLSVDGDVAWKFDYLTKNEILALEKLEKI